MKGWISSFFEFSFLLFIASFFFTLGSDYAPQVYSRMVIGGVLFSVYLFILLYSNRSNLSYSFHNYTFVAFLFLFMFELLRFLWALLQIKVFGSHDSVLTTYLYAPLRWVFYLAFFLLSFSVFKTKKPVSSLLWTLGVSGFILAVNALPPLLLRSRWGSAGYLGYLREPGHYAFFHPLFYSHEILSKYVVGYFAHANYTGDVMALGFFPSLGLLLYSLYFLWDRAQGKYSSQPALASLGLSFIFILSIALTIILAVFARGTMICFLITSLFFILILILKYPSRSKIVSLVVVFLLLIGFLWWGGSLQRTWREIQTLSKEIHPTTMTSFNTNREGATRALRIHSSYPLWGAGTQGYYALSEKFSSPGMAGSSDLATFVVMNHYLTVFAEEGIGAFLYFLFIGVYFFEVGKGLIKTHSRFQFLAGLSFLSSVFMVLLHAAFNHLMEHFTFSMLIYILMGASLGVLRKDFEHN